MALGLVIADETSHFSITYSTGVVDRLPKNSVMLRRNADRFSFRNGSDTEMTIGPNEFDESDVTTPAHADSDALETALHAIIFS